MMLRDVRSKLGLTQAELANRLGVSQNYIAQIEIGRRKMGASMKVAVENLVNSMSRNDIDNDIDKRFASLSARMDSLDARLATIEKLLLRLVADGGGKTGS